MKISELRKKKGLTQLNLAKLLGYHPSAIAQVEAGHRRPWPKFIKAVAKFFKVREEDIQW